jgi:IS30 family transposase
MAECASKKASDVTAKIKELLIPYKDKVYTITADNGKEFSAHELFGDVLDAEYISVIHIVHGSEA